MKEFEIKDRYDMDDYRALIHYLRSPKGCPWDREQTHQSIRRNVLEEAYETAHAIDTEDTENLREELGDLLMQVLLHADMEEEKGNFNLDDVADASCKKLVFRHPHVFGSVRAEDSDAVLRTWDEQKKAEKGQKTVTDSMTSVPEVMPALWRADKIQKKAGEAGFEWPDKSYAMRKLREETEELCEAIEKQDADNIFEEIGDVLFSAVKVARFEGVDPEMALHKACEKFMRRFAFVEAEANALGKKTSDMDLAQLDNLYQRARNVLEGKTQQHIL